MKKKIYFFALFVAVVSFFSCNQKKESEPILSVTADKMNVLFVGIDNPLTIAISGLSYKDINVTISDGEITGGNGKYIARVSKVGKVEIEVTKGDEKIGSAKFRVKAFPTPYAAIGGVSEGFISKDFILKQEEIEIITPTDFDFGGYHVKKFTLGIMREGFLTEEVSQSNKLTENQKELLTSLKPDDFFQITNIIASGPDSLEYRIAPFVLKISSEE